MTYTANVPVSGQTLGNSRPIINSNFMMIPQLIGVNHIGFNLTGAGKHNFVSNVAQGSDPATSANECATYSKIVNSVPQLFFRQQSNGIVYQWTGTSAASSSIPSATTKGYTYLPGGMLMQWGNFADTVATPVAFPVAFPNACFSFALTYTNTNQSVVITALNTTNFAYTKKTATGALIYWIAIGN